MKTIKRATVGKLIQALLKFNAQNDVLVSDAATDHDSSYIEIQMIAGKVYISGNIENEARIVEPEQFGTVIGAGSFNKPTA